MKDNKFNFCPECGSKNIETKNSGYKWQCPDCGFDLYNNVAAACGVLLVNNKGELLFERRGKEPRKGFLALPGGFIDPDERGEEAIIRECREELGIEIEQVKYLCSFPNNYRYKEVNYKTCDMFFTAKLPENVNFNIEESEVQGLEWHKVSSLADLEVLPLAFESARKTLCQWLEKAAGK